MKNKSKLYCNLILYCLYSVIYVNQVHAQEKVNISAGLGMPDFLNVGIRYQLKQTQIGIGFGFMPLKDESLISVSGDYYYHFGGLSEFSKRRPWYGRFGLVYVRDETETLIDKNLYFDLRIGRDFNISKKIGIAIDAGADIQLLNGEVRKKPADYWDIGIDVPVIPAIEIGLFYRL
jgi:hypothetical protein